MMKLHRLAFLAPLAGILLTAPMAHGLSLAPLPPGPDFLGLLGFGAIGSVPVYELRSGPPPGAVLFQGTPAPTDPTLVFDIQLDPVSSPAQFVNLFALDTALDQGINPTGIGWVPGDGSSTEPDGLVDPTAGDSALVQNLLSFYSGPLEFFAVDLQPGTRTNLLFVSFGQLPIGSIVNLDGAGFRVVPEPAADLLLGMALLGLAGGAALGRPRRVVLR